MKKVIALIKEKSGYLKAIFLISVLIIIFNEVANLAKNIDYDQLSTLLTDIPPQKILAILLIGLLCVTPMLGYDILLNKMLGSGSHHKLSYILETSWIINTINNLAGFGGFVSVGLRTAFFGSKRAGKSFFNTLSKVFLFLLSGLSFFSLLSFILIMTHSVDSYLAQYWPMLLGGGLYFPVVILVTILKKSGLLGGITFKTALQLMSVSVMEWAGVIISFVATGLLLDIHFSIFNVIPLFIAASVLGILSMVPGEIGSFDILMVMGLGMFGIQKEVVVVWLLIFRLSYYFVPFLLGILLFFKNMGGRFNARFNGLPKDLASETVHKLVVFFLYFGGIMLVLSGTVPEAFSKIHFLRQINPFSFHMITQMPQFIFGYFLILIGRGFSARVKRVYPMALALIGITFIYTVVHDFSWSVLVILVLLFLCVVFSKSELTRDQLVYSWEMRTIDGFILGALTLLYIFIGLYNRPHFEHLDHHLKIFLIFPTEKIWLAGFFAILIVAFLMVLLLNYMESPKKKLGSPLDATRLENFLAAQGGNSDSQLAFLGDKRLYYYSENGVDLVMFQFRHKNDKLIIMGDPSGNPNYFSKALDQLIHEADVDGYKLVFYEVSETFVLLLHEFGYDFIKMGEKATVNLKDFTLTGKKRKGERALMNRYEREQFQFSIIEPPYSKTQFAELKEVSDEWLNGRTEKGFSLGYFSESYLNRSPIAIVRDAEGGLVGFANIMPTYQKEVATIDLMRYRQDKASGVMDFLFISLFTYYQEKGVAFFDLGMAPLANVGTSRKSFIQERIVYLIFNFGSRFYSFQGLREYKSKYADSWTPRYTLYSRDSGLLFAMIQVILVDDTPIRASKYHGFIQKMLDRI